MKRKNVNPKEVGLSEHISSTDEPTKPIVDQSKVIASPQATDEVYSAASHLIGSHLSLLGLTVLVAKSATEGKTVQTATLSVFGGTSWALFFASFLYHGLHSPLFDRYLRMVDCVSIYLMIASTAAPLCLVFRHDDWSGMTLLGTFWLIAFIGITSHAVFGERLPTWLSNTLYGVMASVGLRVAQLIYPFIGVFGLLLLALGGLAYIVGNVVFILEKPNPIPGRFGFHEIWHSLVLLGAAFHWCLMFQYVQPY